VLTQNVNTLTTTYKIGKIMIFPKTS